MFMSMLVLTCFWLLIFAFHLARFYAVTFHLARLFTRLYAVAFHLARFFAFFLLEFAARFHAVARFHTRFFAFLFGCTFTWCAFWVVVAATC